MRRRWEMPHAPLPQHPFRDSVLVYGGMALVLIIVAWATGGPLDRAVAVAVGFFLVATAWSWSRWRRRLQEADRRSAAR